jgi:putative transposase
LDLIVEQILTHCVHKNIDDIKIISPYAKKCRTPSEDELFEEAVKMVKRFVYPIIVIPIRNNTNITTKDILDVLVHVASDNSFCFDGTKKFRYLHKDKHLPKGDTILYHLSKLHKRYVHSISEKVLDAVFHFAKKEYAIIKNRLVDIAFDVHEIPFYGCKDLWYVLGGKYQNGTSYFCKYVTCSIVVSGRRFTLDVQPLTPKDSLQKILDKMIIRVKSKVHIGICYMDRGFDRISIYHVLKKHHVRYLMPKALSSTVKQWMDKAEGAPAYIVNNFKIGSKNNFVYTTLVLVDDNEGIKRAFSTNLRIGIQIAHKLYYLYSKRWGIETAYRQMDKDFKPRTTSKNYNLRLLYFFFTVILFNFWVLVNICISIKKYGKIIDKPVISGKLFLAVLLTVQVDVG